MSEPRTELAAILRSVRRRWRVLIACRAWTRMSAVIAALCAAALLVHRFVPMDAPGLIALWGLTAGAALAASAWLLVPLRRRPADHQLARYIEERCPELEDTLATAVAAPQEDPSPLQDAVAGDALRRVRGIDLDRVVARSDLRAAATGAVLGTAALVITAALAFRPASQSAHALVDYAFPERLTIQVAPGNARVRAGSPLRIVARVAGASAVLAPTLRVDDGRGWRDTAMDEGSGGFFTAFDSVQGAFRYSVTMAGAASPEYTVTVLHAPRVARIDVHYDYPAGYRMQPRVEEDGGDIYAPAGTRVRLMIHADKPVTSGTLAVADAPGVDLVRRGAGVLEGQLTITRDASYRVALADGDGLTNRGDVEYFIRTLEDSPPDVRIVRPAGDRSVTPIEEVAIEARADDDFGIDTFDLVLSVRGAAEQVVPFGRAGGGPSVTGEQIIYLEELGVRPGDFVTYYARARDTSRGKRSTEARSDIYFLEVKPFDGEFVSAQGSGGGVGTGEDDGSLEALIAGQKDVITATWRLDRRARDAAARSTDDIRSVARAQQDVRRRALGASTQNQRTEDLRRRVRGPEGGGATSDLPLVRAVEAMNAAEAELDALKTSSALPHEMAALNELLRAQAENRRREVQRQQANNGAGGAGSNRQAQDLSSLFDQELAQHKTNYETPGSGETREQKPRRTGSPLDRIRDLARRQDALNREREDLATTRDALSEEERRRRMEHLTREQSELQQQAEELSEQLQRNGQSARGRESGGGSRAEQGRGSRGGEGTPSPGARGAGRPGQDAGRALQQAAEEMRKAASSLRRKDEGQAAASGSRALEHLRSGEQQTAGPPPDERSRELGDARLETQQLADAQRRLAQGSQSGTGRDDDGARRRAAEQGRLADRMQKLEDAIKRLAGAGPGTPGGPGSGAAPRSGLADAARELERQKLSERMRNAARAGRQPGAAASADARGRGVGERVQRAEREAEEIARALDRLGTRLDGAVVGGSPADRQSADRLSRARELRERLEAVDRQLAEVQRSSGGRGQEAAPSRGVQLQPGATAPGNGPGADSQSPGRAAGQGSSTSGAWEQARDLLDELRGEEKLGVDRREIAGFTPGLSAPGTEAFKQDFARWEQLKVQLAAALERVEADAAARLRARQAGDRLNAGGSQAVPEQYRELVDRYYRALASPGAPTGARGRGAEETNRSRKVP